MARTVALSGGYVATVSDKDYKRVVEAGPWHAHVPPDRKTVYAMRNRRKNDDITQVYLHRFILGLTNPKILGDHKDGNGLNNRRKNLRKADASQSQCNRGKQSNNTSGVSGVSWHKKTKKYEAHVKVNNKKQHLGLFSDLRDAKDAVKLARKVHYKQFSPDWRTAC